MQNINNISRNPFDGKRQLYEDEYLKDGLIYCKNCDTPRQVRFKENPDEIFPSQCNCKKEKYEEEEKALKQLEWQNKISNLRQEGIANPSYLNYTFANDDGQTPTTTAICKKYVENFESFRVKGSGLLFYGGVGTGKSYYALCIANALIDKGYPVVCTTLANVVKQAQGFENTDEYYNRLMRKSLIVIDDLGTERGTQFANEQIYKFIDGCYTHNIPLIVTTNFDPNTLTSATEDKDVTYARIYSRIMSQCLAIKVNDIKRRAAKGKETKAKMRELW